MVITCVVPSGATTFACKVKLLMKLPSRSKASTASDAVLPFPSALAVASARGVQSAWVARAWVLNGVASVIATVVAMLLAMSFGFSLVLLFAATAYASAASA